VSVDQAAVIKQLQDGYAALADISKINYHYHDRELVYQVDKVALYHYKPVVKAQRRTASSQKNSVPLLLVFSTVNRPEILELHPAFSLIGELLKKGIEVYLLDWGRVESGNRNLSLHDYVNGYLNNCVKKICTQHKIKKIDVLGVCQGGVLSLCLASISKQINRLILISTPVDFHTADNVITKMVAQLDVETVCHLMGNFSGKQLAQFFISLRPFELLGKKYLKLLDNLEDKAWVERFLRVEKWLQDSPDQPGKAFSEFIIQCYQQNKLIKNELKIGSKVINLTKVTMPVLNIMASEDEIVPVSASLPLKSSIASKVYQQKLIAGGHIGIYISQSAIRQLTRTISNWLNKTLY
jgi:polyhydroxyalkanoate synthase